jgi:hypothetical protein
MGQCFERLNYSERTFFDDCMLAGERSSRGSNGRRYCIAPNGKNAIGEVAHERV